MADGRSRGNKPPKLEPLEARKWAFASKCPLYLPHYDYVPLMERYQDGVSVVAQPRMVTPVFGDLTANLLEIEILGKFWEAEKKQNLGLYLQSYHARP